MSVYGKRDRFTIADLFAVGKKMNIDSDLPIIKAVIESVSQWPRFASKAGVENRRPEAIHHHAEFGAVSYKNVLVMDYILYRYPYYGII